MSERIEVGDLVYVAKWPCCGVFLGVYFTVGAFKYNDHGLLCGRCSLVHATPNMVSNVVSVKGNLCHAPIEWLRKVPPLVEPESIDEEMTA